MNGATFIQHLVFSRQAIIVQLSSWFSHAVSPFVSSRLVLVFQSRSYNHQGIFHRFMLSSSKRYTVAGIFVWGQ